MCVNPILIKNNKNGVISPYRDKKYMTVSCGHCPECLKAKQQSYTSRAVLEFDNIQKQGGFGFFVTLTYDNMMLPLVDGIPTFNKKDVEDYLKVVRINLERKLNWFKPLSYLAVTEYGGESARPHVHITFFHPYKLTSVAQRSLYESIVLDSWQYGSAMPSKTNCGYLIDVRAIFYICKYIGKDISFNTNYKMIKKGSTLFDYDDVDDVLSRFKGFVKCSKSLGMSYIDHITPVEWETGKIFYSNDTTLFIPPYFYRKKFFDKTIVTLSSGVTRVRYVPNKEGIDFQLRRFKYKLDKSRKDYLNIIQQIQQRFSINNNEKVTLLNQLQTLRKFDNSQEVYDFFLTEFPNSDYFFRYTNILRGCYVPNLVDVGYFNDNISTLDLYTFTNYFDYSEDSANILVGDIPIIDYATYINDYLLIHERAHEVGMLIIKLLKLGAYEVKKKEFQQECQLLDKKLCYYWRKQLIKNKHRAKKLKQK